MTKLTVKDYTITFKKYPDTNGYSQYVLERERGINKYDGVWTGKVCFYRDVRSAYQFKSEKGARRRFQQLIDTGEFDAVYLCVFYTNGAGGTVTNGYWWSDRMTNWNKQWTDEIMKKYDERKSKDPIKPNEGAVF